MRFHPRKLALVSVVAVSATMAAPLSASLIVPTRNSSPYGVSVFLDFDGDTTPTWGPYAPGTTPAYDIDGDPTNFSDQELANIHQIWQADGPTRSQLAP